MAHPNMPEIKDLASCVGGLTSQELKTRYSLSFENKHVETELKLTQFINSTFEILESIELQLQSINNRLTNVENYESQLQSINNRLTNVENTIGCGKTHKFECSII